MSREQDNQRIVDRLRGLPAKEDDGTVPGNPNLKQEWKDPECPKCGLKLGNVMSYCCGHNFCPMNMNH